MGNSTRTYKTDFFIFQLTTRIKKFRSKNTEHFKLWVDFYFYIVTLKVFNITIKNYT